MAACAGRLSVGSGLVLTSQVQHSTLEPAWGEEFRLLVKEPATQSLTVELLDWDRFNNDDHIGRRAPAPLALLWWPGPAATATCTQ